MDGAAQELGLSVQESGELGATSTIPGLGAAPAVIAEALKLPPGGVGGPIETPSGAVLFEVVERKTFDPTAFAAARETTRASLERSEVNRLLGSVLDQKKRELKVNYDRPLLEQFGLRHKADDLARTCSGGERRRLEIARALITRPRLLLLDEPFAAVDPHTVEELQSEVRKLASDGIALLITDHNVQQTLRICDRAYIIHDGEILKHGSAADIVADPDVRRLYLGEGFTL